MNCCSERPYFRGSTAAQPQGSVPILILVPDTSVVNRCTAITETDRKFERQISFFAKSTHFWLWFLQPNETGAIRIPTHIDWAVVLGLGSFNDLTEIELNRCKLIDAALVESNLHTQLIVAAIPRLPKDKGGGLPPFKFSSPAENVPYASVSWCQLATNLCVNAAKWVADVCCCCCCCSCCWECVPTSPPPFSFKSLLRKIYIPPSATQSVATDSGSINSSQSSKRQKLVVTHAQPPKSISAERDGSVHGNSPVNTAVLRSVRDSKVNDPLLSSSVKVQTYTSSGSVSSYDHPLHPSSVVVKRKRQANDFAVDIEHDTAKSWINNSDITLCTIVSSDPAETSRLKHIIQSQARSTQRTRSLRVEAVNLDCTATAESTVARLRALCKTEPELKHCENRIKNFAPKHKPLSAAALGLLMSGTNSPAAVAVAAVAPAAGDGDSVLIETMPDTKSESPVLASASAPVGVMCLFVVEYTSFWFNTKEAPSHAYPMQILMRFFGPKSFRVVAAARNEKEFDEWIGSNYAAGRFQAAESFNREWRDVLQNSGERADGSGFESGYFVKPYYVIHPDCQFPDTASAAATASATATTTDGSNPRSCDLC